MYPTKEQEVLLAKTFGCCRLIYNVMLEDKIREYKATGRMLHNTPAGYKKEYPFLKEVDSLALANVQLHLETAYRNFFKNPSTGFPKFKSKHLSRNSYTTNMVNGNIGLQDGILKLPKLKNVRVRQHRQIPDGYQLKSVTVSREPSGKYYASLLYEYEHRENQAKHMVVEQMKILGIDYAMKGLAVFSDEWEEQNERFFRRSEKKLAKEQRKLSHCKRGSRNYDKQKRKVAFCHEKIRHQRKDFIHKLTTKIADAYDVVGVEDLDMKAMSQCLNFGKSVMDNSFGMFRTILTYKLEERGKELVKINRFFPSSKQCCRCGNVKKELKLSERIYRCEICGNEMDRDKNAAINIREEVKRLLTV